MINKFEAQKRISILWFIGFGIILLLVITQILLNRYLNYNKDVIEWFSQNTVPILMLIISTFIGNIKLNSADKNVDKFYFRFTFYISFGYLFILLLVILFFPIGINYSKDVPNYFRSSQLFLTIIQSIVLYSLGLFFIKENPNWTGS